MDTKLNKERTFIKEMKINNFRSLKDVKIDLGTNLTMISGINAVGKSTILGLLAQICSFSYNYYPDEKNGFQKVPVPENFKTVYGKSFESKFKDHFKLSDTYDLPENEYSTNFVINDAEEELVVNAELKGTTRTNGTTTKKKGLRFVLRKDNSISDNTSRNITLPTIYLSLARLTPFVSRNYNIVPNVFKDDEKQLFENFNRSVFNPLSDNNLHISSNKDNKVASTVLTSSKYNIESASTGEDNLGQILAAIISFIRLKNDWSNYKGGLLLIDEIDASLFTKAQVGLLKLLRNVASKYKIQIVFTTHSPVVISEMLDFKKQALQNSKTKNDIGINFLSNSTGSITNHSFFTMQEIVSYLAVTKRSEPKKSKVHCYCEDKEAYTFLDALLDSKRKREIEMMRSINLGGPNIIDLTKRKIPEFSELSITILDGDKKKIRGRKNNITLPGKLPPDQLMFKLLYDEPANSDYWVEGEWDKSIFQNESTAVSIINELEFNDSEYKYNLKNPTSNIKIRELFKNWFNSNFDILKYSKFNPIKKLWIKQNEKEVNTFLKNFDNAYSYVYSKSHFLS